MKPRCWIARHIEDSRAPMQVSVERIGRARFLTATAWAFAGILWLFSTSPASDGSITRVEVHSSVAVPLFAALAAGCLGVARWIRPPRLLDRLLIILTCAVVCALFGESLLTAIGQPTSRNGADHILALLTLYPVTAVLGLELRRHGLAPKRAAFIVVGSLAACAIAVAQALMTGRPDATLEGVGLLALPWLILSQVIATADL